MNVCFGCKCILRMHFIHSCTYRLTETSSKDSRIHYWLNYFKMAISNRRQFLRGMVVVLPKQELNFAFLQVICSSSYIYSVSLYIYYIYRPILWWIVPKITINVCISTWTNCIICTSWGNGNSFAYLSNEVSSHEIHNLSYSRIIYQLRNSLYTKPTIVTFHYTIRIHLVNEILLASRCSITS